MADLNFDIADLDKAANDAVGTKSSSKPTVSAPIRANNPGALMPGGKLAQFKTPEEGLKAIDDNLTAYGKKGVNTLAGVITRWAPPNENDTQSYISHVAQVTGLNPSQPIDLSNPLVRHQISAGIVQHENGRKAIYASDNQPPSFANVNVDDITKAANEATSGTSETSGAGGNGAVLEKMSDKVGRYLRQFGQQAAATADIAYGIVPAAAGTAAYAFSRLGQTPEQAARVQEAVQSQLEKPFGKAFGVTETAGYKGEPITNLMQFVGQNVDKGADWIAAKTGMPKSDVQQLINTALAAAPGLKATKTYETVSGAVKNAGQKAAETVGSAVGAAQQAVSREAGYATGALSERLGMQTKPTAAPKPAGGPAAPQPTAGFGAQTAGAAQPTVRNFANEITGIEQARGQYPQIKLSKTATNVPETEQQLRAQIINEVMGDSGRVRTGAITGNENTLRNEHALAKLAGEKQTPESEVMRQQFANEQTALSNYAEQRVKNTGASDLLLSDSERGERINSAFAGDEGLTGVIRQEKGRLYDNVRNTIGNNPIQSSNIDSLLQNKQFRAGLGLKGNEGVARSAEELINLAKTEGFEENGVKYAPNTVNGWIAVQKALNREWSPSNAGVIRQLNQAIERDIGAAGGLNTLKQADSLHQAEKQLFESKGIKELFGEIDPNGVEKGTAFEKILPKLNSLPINQWRHVYGTAERIASGKLVGPVDAKTGLPKWEVAVPDDLKTAAQSALQEMRGGLAREIYQAGAGKVGEWNSNAVNKVLNARADKIREAFTPAEQAAFHKLNVAGQLMPGVHAYEGAAQQAMRVGGIVQSHLPKVTGAAGAALGGGLFGPGGAAVGGYVAGKGGTKISESMIQRAQQKAAVQRVEELRRNAQKGTNPISGIAPRNP